MQISAIRENQVPWNFLKMKDLQYDTTSPSAMAANLASAYAEGFMIYIDSMGPKDHKK